MSDVFTKANSVGSVINRKGHSTASGKFSPSFGVRRGLIKDPNWPPAQFPEHGTAASRRFRRVELNFDVELRGESVSVRGDVSQGGAMFLLDRRVETKHVDIVAKGKAARAEVLSTSKKGNAFAHHCRFIDSSESMPVWEAVTTC
ncbi:MAG TPA: PilZ domain-containing protein [Archangium sp.]